MTELSPAAKAIDDAFWKTINDKWNIYDRGRAQFAAALEAVADQVVPEHKPWHRTDERGTARHDVRLELLAIAAELRGDTAPTNQKD